MATILVVDDDLAMRDTMFDILSLDGHDVVLADDGIDAMKRFRDQMPDLVITDLQMPGGDGIELLRSLDVEFMGVPVIVMSGTTDVTLLEEAVENSANRVITKPFDVDALLNAVAEMTAEDPIEGVSAAADIFRDSTIG